MFQKVGFSIARDQQAEDQRKERYVRLQEQIIEGLGAVGYRLKDVDSCTALLHVLAWMMKRAGYTPDDFESLAAHVRDDVWSPLDRSIQPRHLC